MKKVGNKGKSTIFQTRKNLLCLRYATIEKHQVDVKNKIFLANIMLNKIQNCISGETCLFYRFNSFLATGTPNPTLLSKADKSMFNRAMDNKI